MFQYNPATQESFQLTPMPTAQCELEVTVHQDRLYAIGGYDGKHTAGAVEVFDPQINTYLCRLHGII